MRVCVVNPSISSSDRTQGEYLKAHMTAHYTRRAVNHITQGGFAIKRPSYRCGLEQENCKDSNRILSEQHTRHDEPGT